MCFFCFKQKTAYEMRISDWSSDVCSSDLCRTGRLYKLGSYYFSGGQRCGGKFGRTELMDVGAGHRHGRKLHRPVATLSQSCTDRLVRSEERRVGKECVSTCRSRWLTYH